MSRTTKAVALTACICLMGVVGCQGEVKKTRDHVLAGMTLQEASAFIKKDAGRVYQFAPLKEGDEAPNDLHDDASPDWTIVAACSSDGYVEDSDWIELAVVPNRLVTDEIYHDIVYGDYRDRVSCVWIHNGMKEDPRPQPNRPGVKGRAGD